MNIDCNKLFSISLPPIAFLTLSLLSNSCVVQNAQSVENKQSRNEIQNSTPSASTARSGCQAFEDKYPYPKTFPEWQGSDLHRAISERNLAAFRRLLKQGVDVNEKDNYENTPLSRAVNRIIREPKELPPDVRRRRAQKERAVELEMTRALLARGADANQPSAYGMTPIIDAAYWGTGSVHAIKLLTLLIEHKADVNAQDERGITALMFAAQNNNPEVIKFLLDHGANPNLTDCEGQTALSIAQSLKYADAVRALENAK